MTPHLYRSNGEKRWELNAAAGAVWSEAVSLSADSYALVAPENPA